MGQAGSSAAGLTHFSTLCPQLPLVLNGPIIPVAMVSDSLKFLKDEAGRLAQENHALREELTDLRQSARALSTLYHVSQHITQQVDVLKLLRDILDSALT